MTKRRIFEAESVDENAVDTIFVLNEHGRLEEVEVKDDADDD